MATIGEIRQKFPMYSDVPDGELVRGLHKKFYSDIPYSDFLKKIDFSKPVDPTEGMSETQKFLAGTGKGMTDIARGVGQAAGVVPQSSIDESRKLDAPLMNTGAGVAGSVVGTAAALSPTAFIPGVNTYTGAALLGAGSGAVAPVATGDSRLLNTAFGAGAGVAGQGIGRGISRALQPVQSSLTPEQQALAAAASARNIPLSVGQQTGSRPIQTVESVLENLPFTASNQAAQKQAQASAFNREVLSQAGIQGTAATPAALGAQKKALGQTFEGIASRNAIDFNQGVTGDLSSIVQNASRRLTPDKAQGVANVVDDIFSQVDQSGKLTGPLYQAWRGELRKLGQGTDYESSVYQSIRKALDTAFHKQVSGADAQAWKQASTEYANLKTILDAMGGAGAGTKSGNISPAQLEGALTRQIGREGKALGRGDLNELVSIGRQFVSESIPNSGTPQRQFMQNLMTMNLPGAGVGGAAGYAAGGDPQSALTGAALGLGVAGAGPTLTQAFLNSPAGKAYLTSGLLSLSPAQMGLLTAAGRAGVLGGALSYQP
jgi:hypothetical protein